MHWTNRKFDGGDFSATSANLWIFIAENMSVSLALYYLLAFYQVSKRHVELSKTKPLWKFSSIKLLIFFAFWQTMLIKVMSAMGFIASRRTSDMDRVAVGFSDYLLIVEMAVLSVVHTFVFSASEHSFGYYSLDGNSSQEGIQSPLGRWKALKHSLSLADVFQDLAKTAESLPRLLSHAWSLCVASFSACYICLKMRSAVRSSGHDTELAYRWWYHFYSGDSMVDGTAETPEVKALKQKLSEAQTADERLDLQARMALAESRGEAP